MKPPAASNTMMPPRVPSVDADPAASRESEYAPDAGADGMLSDGQLDAVAGGTVRAVVRPLLVSSPAFGALPPGEQTSIAKDL